MNKTKTLLSKMSNSDFELLMKAFERPPVIGFFKVYHVTSGTCKMSPQEMVDFRMKPERLNA